MRTYAEYLATMTVKTLHAIAKQGGYKGYSKLRKAELVAFIDGKSVIDYDGALAKLATDFAAKQSAPAVTFSEVPVSTQTPVKAPESAPKATAEQTPSTGTPEDSDTAELVYAYRAMRATIKNMGNTPARVKIVGRLRIISAQLKAQGMRPACL